MDKHWESRFLDYFARADHDHSDGSHDLAHFRRVVSLAKHIADMETESADRLVLLAAAYFHDIVSLPKNHPERNLSSRYAAEKAQQILSEMNFPGDKIAPVCHAIHAHSFSAQVTPETLEAKIIQDADRMESLGALGAMRTFYVAGRLGNAPYHPTDLFASQRPLDDKSYALDHFYCKLFKLPDLLQTAGGRQIAQSRTEFMQQFVRELVSDLQNTAGGALAIVQACYEAGANSRKLCDAADPFAENRPIDTTHYVVDRLMDLSSRERYIPKFLKQFRHEIEGT